MLILFLLTFNVSAQQPIISGYVDSHQSKILNQERRFMVDVPENYHDNDLTYPTLYVIDSDFQFQHVSAVAKNLARMGKIPPMIVVGVANQGNADYIYHTTWQVEGEHDFGGAKSFHQYIATELVPIIDQAYRTNDNRIMSGYSLGGLFTTYTMIQADTPFNAFLAMSPSYWVDDYAAADNISQYIGAQLKQGKQPAPLFLSVANEQGMGVKKVLEKLQALNIENWPLQFKAYPDENHFSTSLPAIVDALTFLFKDFYEDGYALAEHKDIDDVLATFKQKQQHYNGFRIEWLQAYKLARYVFSSKQIDKVDALLAAVEKDFPSSLLSVTNYLAKGFNAKKRFQEAQTILDKVAVQGKNNALWHHQYSKAMAGLEHSKKAEHYQTTAMQLADKQQLPMWQIWEMK